MTNLKTRYGPWALIAGGSEGIGERLAHRLASAGINLLLVARRQEPLDAAAAALRGATGAEVRTLALDLTAADMVETIAAATDGLEIGMLIYNAGVDSRYGDVVDRSVGNLRRIIGLNVVGQTLLVHHFGGKMRDRGRGGIILMGSMLGMAGGGGMSAYAASKAYVHTLSKGLWWELKPHGVDVLGLIVGATRTPAYERMGLPVDSNGLRASEPDLLADEALEQLGKVPVWVPSDQQALGRHIESLSPADAVAMVSGNAKAMQGS